MDAGRKRFLSAPDETRQGTFPSLRVTVRRHVSDDPRGHSFSPIDGAGAQVVLVISPNEEDSGYVSLGMAAPGNSSVGVNPIIFSDE